MKRISLLAALLVNSLLVPGLVAQTSAPANQETGAAPTASTTGTAPAAVVPQLIKFSGTLADADGNPLPGPVGVTFALYAEQAGGAALWMETQNVTPKADGSYTVLLGAASSEGVPTQLFTSGEAHWLGIQVEAKPEQPRVLLVSVPYAMKAADAETLGGRPASAYMAAPGGGVDPDWWFQHHFLTGTGTPGFLSVFTDTSTLGNSNLFQSNGMLGVGTTKPMYTLDVHGTANVTGHVTFGSTVTFAPGQTFPGGSGGGTITGVTAGTGLTGGGTSGTVTLNLNTAYTNTLYAQLSGNNSFSGINTFTGNSTFGATTFTGPVTGTTFTGNGSGLMGVNALSLGGMPAGAFALLGSPNSFSALQTFNGGANGSSFMTGGGGLSFTGTGNGSALDLSSTGNLNITSAGNLSLSSGGSGGFSFTGANGGGITYTPSASGNTLSLSGGSGGGIALNGPIQVAGSGLGGGIDLTPTGTATAGTNFDSNALEFSTSVFNSASSTAVPQNFVWQAEPTPSTSGGAPGSLNLLFGSGTIAPAETGLSVASNGIITFAAGQMFGGGSGGAITGVTAGTGLLGGGTSGSVTLSLDTAFTDARYAQLGATNTTFVGQTVFTSSPTGTGASQGALYINPATASAGQTLFGAAVGGTQEMVLDSGGNLTLGGSLNLPAAPSDPAAGLINIGGTSFASVAGPSGAASQNTFIGLGSGSSMVGGGASAAAKRAAQAVAARRQQPQQPGVDIAQCPMGSDSDGWFNTAAGGNSLSDITTGCGNTAIGDFSLFYMSGSNYDTGVGFQSLFYLGAGSFDTAVGQFSGGNMSAGSYNTFLGYDTGVGVATEIDNATAIGASAAVGCSNCLVLGSINGVNSAAASVNVGIGTQSPNATLDVEGNGNGSGSATLQVGGNANITGGLTAAGVIQSTAGGFKFPDGSVQMTAVSSPIFGLADTAVGLTALSTGAGQDNAALGAFALAINTGSYNTATGAVAMANNTSGTYNTATGYTALLYNISGSYNTATGSGALALNTSGSYNTATGYNALKANTSAGNNSAFGYEALSSNTTGGPNSAFGFLALNANSSGNDNAAFGFLALSSNTMASNNSAFGDYSLVSNTGANNAALGYYALNLNTTGSNNSALGANAGQTVDNSNLTTNNNTFLGASTAVSTGNLANVTAIGSNAMVGCSDCVVLGSIAGMNGATSSVNVGIGTATPVAVLDIEGNGNGHASTTLQVGGNANITGTLTVGSCSGCGGSGGTITGVTAGTGLSGGGTSGTLTLGIDPTVVPELTANNTFSGSNTFSNTGNAFMGNGAGLSNVNALSLGGYSAGAFAQLAAPSNTFTGTLTGGTVNATNGFNLNGTPFGFGSTTLFNAYLGFAGTQSASNTGSINTGVGSGALGANTTGFGAVAVGYLALSKNTAGEQNTAVGSYALASNTSGSSNTASGSTALYANTTGGNNTATGYESLTNNTTGYSNTSNGWESLANNTTGSGNTGFGNQALQINTTGSYNTALGFLAGPVTNKNLTNATAIGAYADVEQNYSLVLGSIAGMGNCNVGNNCVSTSVGIGTVAPQYTLDVHGTANVTGTLYVNGQQLIGSTGNFMLSGDLALPSTTGASAGVITLGGMSFIQAYNPNNTFVGLNAGNFTMSGAATGNTGIGTNALQNIFSGYQNTASGLNSMLGTTSGFGNAAYGVASLQGNTTGQRNTVEGSFALYVSTSGNNNTSIGSYSLASNSTGSGNTALGAGAGYGPPATGGTANTTGSNNTYLGFQSGTLGTYNNATAIGADALVNCSYCLVLGSVNGVNGATQSTMVGIGTSSPAATLDVEGTTAGSSSPPALKVNGVANFTGNASITGNLSVTGSISCSSGCSSGGTLTGVTAGMGLTGGGTSGTLTLGIDPTVVPELTANNTFSGSNTFSNVGNTFAGNGAGLTALNPANLSAGTAAINISGNAATAGNASMLGGAPPNAYALAGSTSNPVTQTIAGVVNLQGNIGMTALNGVSPTFTVTDMNGSSFSVSSAASFTGPLGSGGTISAMDNASGQGGALNIQGNTAPANGTIGSSVNVTAGNGNGGAGGNISLNPGTGTTNGLVNVNGSLSVGGASGGASTLMLLPAGTAKESADFNSNVLEFSTSVFNSGSSAAVTENFVWQAEPTPNESGGAPGTLNLLFGSGTSAPVETGLSINSSGQVNFAPGQTFPITGTNGGTVTAITAGNGLLANGQQGGTINSSGILTLDPTVVAELAASNNTFAGSLAINPATASAGQSLLRASVGGTPQMVLDSSGDLTLNGSLNLPATNAAGTAGVINLGGQAFALGTPFQEDTETGGNVYLGYAGNQNVINNSGNTGVGYLALADNSSGGANTAMGQFALSGDTSGAGNSAFGQYSLNYAYTGSYNTAVGNFAGQTLDFSVITNNNNTFLGSGAALAPPPNQAGVVAGGLTNATAVGSNAVVACSNCMVLGSIARLNNGPSNVNVGIGTTNPGQALEVVGNIQIDNATGTQYGLVFPDGSKLTSATNLTNAESVNVMTGNAISGTTDGSGNNGITGSNNSGSMSGGSNGVYGSTNSPASAGTVGVNFSMSGSASGVYGQSNSYTGNGVYGTGATGVYGQSSTVGSNGVFGTNSATSGSSNGVAGNSYSPGGAGTVGVNFATSGNGSGVYGQSNSSAGYGVYGTGGSGVSGTGSYYGVVGKTTGTYGFGFNAGVAGMSSASGPTYGVYGVTNSSAGVGVTGAGPGFSQSSGMLVGGAPIGVWGDTEATGGATYDGGVNAMPPAGVLATADDALALLAANNSDVTGLPTIMAVNSGPTQYPQGPGIVLLLQSGYAPAAQVGFCNFFNDGTQFCTGPASSVVSVDGGNRQVALPAVQSTENWFEDFGSGQLTSGVATIKLDPVFAQTVNTEMEYHVYLTPNGECEGLYVTAKTAGGFEVHELHHGTSNISFDYRIVAHRKGYENIRLADETGQVKRIERMRPRPKDGSTPAAPRSPQPLASPLAQARPADRPQ